VLFAVVAALVLAALLVVREVAARRRQTQLLAEMEALRGQVKDNDRLVNVGQLMSGLAQDLKSPLQGVLGSAELLAASDPSTAGSAQGLREIRDNVSRAVGIVRNLIAFSETTILDRRWHDLNELVRNAVQRHHGEGDSPEHATFQGTTRLQLVYIDGPQIEKVLATLLSHTARGSRHDPAGNVVVTTRRVAGPVDHLIIDIDDPRAFDADDEAVWSGELDACQRVLEAHGGSLQVQRQAAGAIRFHLELPITELVEKQAT
jgi:two-component system sensor kinase FixL